MINVAAAAAAAAAAASNVGLLAVRNLTFENHSNNLSIGLSGMCAQLGSFMQRHVTSEGVVKQACMAVRNLSYNCPENSGLICDSGACEVIAIEVLRVYRWCPGVSEQCFLAMRNLFSHDRCKRVLGSGPARHMAAQAVEAYISIQEEIETEAGAVVTEAVDMAHELFKSFNILFCGNNSIRYQSDLTQVSVCSINVHTLFNLLCFLVVQLSTCLSIFR